MKHWIVALLTVTMLGAASQASAQSAYSPKKASIADLIQPATYSRVPVHLLEHNPVRSTTVYDRGRLDFQSSYDVPYWDLISWIEERRSANKPITRLDPEAFPNANSPELKVFGSANVGTGMSFTLGNIELPYRISITIYPDDQSKAVVVVQNSVYALIYSGGVPARAPFKPAGNAKEIRFRWN